MKKHTSGFIGDSKIPLTIKFKMKVLHFFHLSLSVLGEEYFFFCLLGPYLQYMEVPRLGVKSELYPPAYIIATVMQDLSRVCDLYHNSWQH